MSEKLYLYTVYERIWHWLQTVLIFMLIFTGAGIRFPDYCRLCDFLLLVRLHKILGFVLLVNAFLALFYHLSTGYIKQFIPEPKDFISMAIRLSIYYMRDIFRGEWHPFKRDFHHKLNPLQQIIYLVILNILLPFQVISGILLWGSQYWPDQVDRLIDVSVLTEAHSLASWLFVAFIIGHVYMTTTGPTPLSYLKGMITGWEEVEASSKTEES